MQAAPIANAAGDFGISKVSTNGCATYVSAFTLNYTAATATDESNFTTAGFLGSSTTCYEYLVDEMSLSGRHWINQYDQDFESTTAKPVR